MAELLSISIPTRNRAAFLRELLACIRSQLDADYHLARAVKVYLFDNDSLDETQQVVQECGFDLVYKRNSTDIGADQNILQAYTMVEGEYVWAIGDDELLPDGALETLIHIISQSWPDLILNKSPEYLTIVQLPHQFQNYQRFAQFAAEHNPHLLIAHSLISAMVVRRSCFDSHLAAEMIHTHYSHMYGIVSMLKQSNGKVIIPMHNTLLVREPRVPPVDGAWPDAILNDQIEYLEWVVKTYELHGIVPSRVLQGYLEKVEVIRRGRLLGTLHNQYRRIEHHHPFLRPALKAVSAAYRAGKCLVRTKDNGQETDD